MNPTPQTQSDSMARKSGKPDRVVVYSTESGRQEQSDSSAEYPSSPDGIVRIRRETKGRGGKTVTTVNGVGGTDTDLKVLARTLRKACGSGGSVKEGVIVIQGDHRVTVQAALEAQGYRVKLAGG